MRSGIQLPGSDRMLGAHNSARGLLVETCRHTGAHPTGLHYAETMLVDGAIVVVEVIAAQMPLRDARTATGRSASMVPRRDEEP